MMTPVQYRDHLAEVLLEPDPTDGLWEVANLACSEKLLPELGALALEQDPVHKHKDVLAHTIAVTANTSPDLVLRLAALFHDIGKPRTRRYGPDGVTFRHHEAVGAKMTRKRMEALGYDEEMIHDVSELVRLSGRFKGFASGWTDSAVRRYARDAGHLLGKLNELVRCDCTTRSERKRADLHRHVDALEKRIIELAAEDRRAAERPLIDGSAVMARYGAEPGPLVGKALKFLLELKRNEPELDVATTEERLDLWWDENAK